MESVEAEREAARRRAMPLRLAVTLRPGAGSGFRWIRPVVCPLDYQQAERSNGEKLAEKQGEDRDANEGAHDRVHGVVHERLSPDGAPVGFLPFVSLAHVDQDRALVDERLHALGVTFLDLGLGGLQQISIRRHRFRLYSGATASWRAAKVAV